MKIVIAGAGEMGSHLARMLSGNGHDITIIDSDQKLLSEVGSLADVITVEGDSTTFAVLREASVRKCDLFIAVNHEENDNVVAAMLAKKLGARKSIARIDNNEYLEPNNKEMFIDMGIDYLFYPEKVAAREVINLLGHTSTTEYVDFSSGKLSLVVFRLEPASPLVGEVLTGFDDDQAPLSYRTVAITRSGETIIPRQGEIFTEGDVIYVIAPGEQLQPLLPLEGRRLTVEGQLRSFNNKSGQGSRLVISVFARVLTEAEENDDCNEIQLQGVLCKPPVLRRTPLGRCICDMMLAVNRRYGRADYLPCIAWGAIAQQTAILPVGSRLTVEGRVQSRGYTKTVDGVGQERTAYEVSIMRPAEPEEFFLSLIHI